MALQAGQLFGNYRVVHLIGEGAFGEVYLAENPLIGRRAAIKVLRPMLALDTELVRRFFNEARAASAIRHPNIIDIYDAGETSEGSPYILMEFLEGKSLRKCLTEVAKCSLAQTLEVARQAGSALAAAHAVGIVHRDLKPENLFLVPDATGGERVKILDFGIAKVKASSAGGVSGSFRTEAGLIMGSPTYMSPEQCKDSADVDLRADIYSFATILYEMLAGRPPYVAATGVELLLMHLSEPPQPLHELIPGVPDLVEDAIMRALCQERSERFEAVPRFLEALRGPARGDSVLAGEAALAAEAISGLHLDRPPAGAAARTLSQASPVVVLESGIPTHVVRRSFRRWLGFTIAGLVALGLFMLFQLQRGQDPSPPVVHGATVMPMRMVAGVAGPSGPTRLSAPERAISAGLPHPVDSEARSHATPMPSLTPDASDDARKEESREAKIPAAGKSLRRHPIAARVRTTPPKHRSASSATAPQPDEDDVAGF